MTPDTDPAQADAAPSFDAFGLDESVLVGVRAAGFLAPRPIQVLAIPPALEGRDVLGLARTGTGKTAAFALPILQRLVGAGRAAGARPRALVLAPTRELAQQIAADVERLGGGATDGSGSASGSGTRVALVIGGVPAEAQARELSSGAMVVVATVGRLLDLVHAGHCDLGGVEVLVLDEADRMVDMGFLPDVRRLIDRVPPDRQVMMFSATMPEAIQALAQRILREPEIIDLGNAAPAEAIDHALLPVRSSAKMKLLTAILKGEGFRSAIVFVRTKQRAKAVSLQLEKRGFTAALLHGDRKQKARERALAGFKDGSMQVLVATDLASRGLDVESVSHVVNYDVPLDADTYVHRIGRTGRSEQSGIAFTLVSRGDLPAVRAIEHRIGARLERRFLDGFAVLEDEDLAEDESRRRGRSARR